MILSGITVPLLEFLRVKSKFSIPVIETITIQNLGLISTSLSQIKYKFQSACDGPIPNKSEISNKEKDPNKAQAF